MSHKHYRLTLLSLLVAVGCHPIGVRAKRQSENSCPTDIRQTLPWCAGEDAVFTCPCGPTGPTYGARPTCWREWPMSATQWREMHCGASCPVLGCNGAPGLAPGHDATLPYLHSTGAGAPSFDPIESPSLEHLPGEKSPASPSQHEQQPSDTDSVPNLQRQESLLEELPRDEPQSQLETTPSSHAVDAVATNNFQSAAVAGGEPFLGSATPAALLSTFQGGVPTATPTPIYDRWHNPMSAATRGGSAPSSRPIAKEASLVVVEQELRDEIGHNPVMRFPAGVGLAKDNATLPTSLDKQATTIKLPRNPFVTKRD